MKKIFKILIATVIAISCAVSLVACSNPGSGSDDPGLHVKKMGGVYTIYKYVAEDGVTELDIDEKIDDEITEIRIKKGAFSGNSTIKTLIIPSRVTKIDEGAFENMKSLETLVVPFVGLTANSDAYLGESQKATDKAVDKARTIAHFFGSEEYDAGIPVTINYNGSSKAKVYMPMTFKSITVKAQTAYTIPMYAFNGAVNLLNVNLEGNIDGIGEAAFTGCKEIKSISLPVSVTNIYKDAFNGCAKLNTLSLQTNAALTVLDGAFVGTNLDRNVLDNAVAGIDEQMKDRIFGVQE